MGTIVEELLKPSLPMADLVKAGPTMEPDAQERKRIRIAALNEEIHSIHAANRLYWEQGEDQSRTARAEYRRRLDRLEEIRSELAQLGPA